MPAEKKTGPAISSGQGAKSGKVFKPPVAPELEEEMLKAPIPVPIGIPISVEEYERLKKEAALPRGKPSPAAQQDSTETDSEK